jgi:hypothetical protein
MAISQNVERLVLIVTGAPTRLFAVILEMRNATAGTILPLFAPEQTVTVTSAIKLTTRRMFAPSKTTRTASVTSTTKLFVSTTPLRDVAGVKMKIFVLMLLRIQPVLATTCKVQQFVVWQLVVNGAAISTLVPTFLLKGNASANTSTNSIVLLIIANSVRQTTTKISAHRPATQTVIAINMTIIVAVSLLKQEIVPTVLFSTCAITNPTPTAAAMRSLNMAAQLLKTVRALTALI